MAPPIDKDEAYAPDEKPPFPDDQHYYRPDLSHDHLAPPFGVHGSASPGAPPPPPSTGAPGPGPGPGFSPSVTPTDNREAASRLGDDLEVIRAERIVSDKEKEKEMESRFGKTTSRAHGNSASEDETIEPFSEHHNAQANARVRKRDTDAALYRFWMWLRKFPRFIRYVLYMIPGAALILVPVLLGVLEVKDHTPIGGPQGVYLTWFGVWLEVIWCGFWVSRMITSVMPSVFGGVASVFGSGSPRKWKEIGRQLELHTALFIWLLAILVSFAPILNVHRAVPPGGGGGGGGEEVRPLAWTTVVWRVVVALFVCAVLNFVEKILIQWIATSFHQRTYATRIHNNKDDTQNLVSLYTYAKARLAREDSIWQTTQGGGGHDTSGSRTPMQAFQQNARQAVAKVGAVANRFGNDFIGRKVDSNHPRKVVGELLRNQAAAHTLARLLYRSLVREGNSTVYLEDMLVAFDNDRDRAEVAFAMFDKDLNNDVSMEEFEVVANEIHLEKKAIAASLKDLDSVINKLDKVLLVIVVIVSAIVFVSIISSSAASALASAGTSILALSWMLQATAQEFLQSIIFVFVKHPFDVGDRITIYGTTGVDLKGDDFYVTEVSLLYTEFKKLGGQIVQAPNSVLNTLFILNMRRSNGIADVIELKMRFGTPIQLIEELKERMLQYCLLNKRDFQAQIITEVRTLDELRAVTVNFVFVHKSNYQNEMIRLGRHNKFAAELMAQMVELGIQGPLRTEPGGSREFPLYYASLPPPQYENHYGATVGPPPQHPSAASPAYAGVRGRADSRTTAGPLVAAGERGLLDFQDVFDNRKEAMTRLASIREKRSPMASPIPLSPQLEDEGSSSNVNLHRIGTGASGDRPRRLFSRVRSRSRTGRPSMDV